MRIEEIIENIDKILKLDPEKQAEALRNLKRELKIWLKKVERGNYVYLYEIEYETDETGKTKENILRQFARIPKNIYKKHYNHLEELRTKRDLDGLRRFLKNLKENI